MHTVTDFPFFVGNKTAANTPGWKCYVMRSTGHDYKLETRKLSCYCLNCLEEIDQCQNIDYCHRWGKKTLKVLKTLVSG
jgi:hypothetical protein